MEDLLTKFGFNTKTVVGVSISSNNLIEMICVDKTSRSIIQYAAREIRYNNAIREIVDYDELSTALSELFRELHLNPKSCKVMLNMPNVQFAFIHLPLILPDDQVTNAIASEVEQLYLFKRHEPVISWNTVDQSQETDKRYIVYSAIQDSAIQSIREVFEDLGAQLIAVENSHSSMLKGVQYSRILEDEMESGASFNILLITSNSYAIFCMSGHKVVDYYEEPLAIKSFTDDEVYLAISSAAGSTLEHYPTQNLLIISETNDVSAELLSSKISFDGAIKYLDRNKFSDQSFINLDVAVLQAYLPLITLESVGIATYNYEQYPVKFNFLSEVAGVEIASTLSVNVFGKEVELDKKAIGIIMAAVFGCLIVFFLLIGLLLNASSKKMAEEIAQLDSKQQELEAKIKESKISVDVADIYTISQQIYTENKKELALFNALSADIPREVWVEGFRTNSDGEVYITGKATGSDYIYTFFRSLKASNPDIFISQLQLDFDNSSPIPDLKSMNNIYLFEIKSTKNKKPPEETGAEGENAESPDAQKQPSFPFFGMPKQDKNAPAPAAPPASPMPSNETPQVTPVSPPQSGGNELPPPISAAP